MFNLMKMNIYKITHMKSFYIIPLIMVFFICLVFIPIQASMFNSTSDLYIEITFYDLFNDMTSSGIIYVMIGISSSFIASADYKKGFIKNYAGQVNPKGIAPVAKLPAAALEIIFIFAAAIASCIISGSLMIDNFVIGSAVEILKTTAVQILLGVGLSSFIIFIANLNRSSALSIVITICIYTGITGLAADFINFLLKKYLNFPDGFDIGVIAIERYTRGITPAAAGKFTVYAVIAAVAYIVIPSAASFFITKKRDI